MSVSIPDIFDPSDPVSMRQFCVAVKQYCDELARKALSSQEEVRTTAPVPDDLEEGEQVRATVGGLNYIYTKMNGVILRTQIS